MTSSKKDIPKNQTVPKGIVGKTDTSEDEIDLVDLFLVLWKRKYFIILFAILPVLVVFSFYKFKPNNYEITYIYDTWLNEEPSQSLSGDFKNIKDIYELPSLLVDDLLEKNFRKLVDKFYSEEMLSKLAAKLQENGFNEYASQVSKTQIPLEISEGLITLTVTGNPKKDIQQISSIVRDNFEKVLPMYTVRGELIGTIAGFKAGITDIEENKFDLELELKRKRAISEKLNKMEPADSNNIPGGIILQFDNVSQNSEYLPLSYQIQAVDANIITLEENIKANQEKYNYYNNLIKLNERLLDEVENKISSYYTIQQFHSFLTNITNDYTEKELADYLNAYIKRIENMISINTPVIEKPRVCPVPKGAVKKSAVSFAALLIIASFIAFLLEAVKRRQAPAP